MKHYLVVYDIADPKRLNRVAKIMKDYGVRVQKSKFEVDVSRAGFQEMSERILAVIEPAEDGVKFIPLCLSCRSKTEILGRGRFVDPDGEFLVL
ncbi:MAG: CRISPR-associated endonuclease Cas2 [Deltaproteobacteria bacterium CG23_combo_of_CG06-09_8_20_14_all_60_8]|nr:MAG: CRISPR-associated endonuclease Cas2 [Deltaproteobacteria bacterium CG23_combo_of_CG06-09_8_20_14_all_60_8]